MAELTDSIQKNESAAYADAAPSQSTEHSNANSSSGGGISSLRTIFSVILMGFILHVAVRAYHVFQARPIQIHDALECSAVELPSGMSSTEDITHYRDGILLVSSGSLRSVLYGDISLAPPGGILALDIQNRGLNEPHYAFEVLHILARPERAFHPHGIFLSNMTNRLYVVNHPFGDLGSIIEIFDIVPGERFPHLSYLGYVHDKQLFGRGALNDIVEDPTGSGFYVTTWKPVDLPHNGMAGEITTFKDRAFKALNGAFANLLWVVYPATYVTRCSFDLATPGDNKKMTCEKVAAGFYCANGITTNANRTLLFVNDVADLRVTVYDIDNDGSLKKQKNAIHLPYIADNIDYDESTGKIFASILPDPMTFLGCAEHAKNVSFDMTDCPITGGFYPIENNGPDGTYVANLEESVTQDGRQMSGTSIALQYGDTFVMGSALDNRALVCKRGVQTSKPDRDAAAEETPTAEHVDHQEPHVEAALDPTDLPDEEAVEDAASLTPEAHEVEGQSQESAEAHTEEL